MTMTKYLDAMQGMAMQLEAILGALDAVCADDKRRSLMLSLISDGRDVARELNRGLDLICRPDGSLA